MPKASLRDYPYGKVLRSMNPGLGAEETKYKFSGKERDVESGLDYRSVAETPFGLWRKFYDSDIARWWNITIAQSFFPGLK